MSHLFRVVLGPLARNDLEEAYEYAASREPVAAADGIIDSSTRYIH